MKIKRIDYAPYFLKRIKRLPFYAQQLAWEKEEIFREKCFYPLLRTHKLNGKLSGYWSFSINYNYRILFQFLKSDEVVFVDIGTHEIYQ